ncbi:MAG: M1 family metallopeptidase [Gemmatimonadetes bacterium]|nr:M1 family metallopeptidase [Gemmatimonadota bacterium]
MRVLLPALLALLASDVVLAQSVADTSRFQPLPLPAPNVYRTAAGRPGPQYWQQRVDYRLAAELDTAANVLHGQGTITYRNNSPDALPYLWLYLDQNICAPGSITATLNQPPLVFQDAVFDFGCRGFAGGITLEHVRSGGRDLPYQVYGTTMKLPLPAALAPGGTVELDVAWRFPIPEYGAGRMGRDGALYEIAWWYPRLAVYDDVRGWNTDPYIGAGEFYLEYGSFDVQLTVPASFLVTATGALQNPETVLTQTQRDRLTRALAGTEPVAIVTAAEAGKPVTRPARGGRLTWSFHADDVRDFAFAAGNELRWDAAGYDGILIQTFYRPRADKWSEGIRMARHSIEFFSKAWYRYPYPHATTVEGPIEGMEYPMLTFVPSNVGREDLYWVLMHEFGHEWYPMVVGSNERLYPWMDEGFNSFIDLYASADYFRGTAYGDTVADMPLHLYPQHALSGEEQPLSTRPVESKDLFWTAYRKPSLMLKVLREEVLGPERFDAAFRDYTATWAYKHPTPADFFRLMGDASGMQLDWFWRDWIYTTARLDQAVAAVREREDGTHVLLENRGTMLLPAELALTYADGKTETVKLPIEMWNLGSHFAYRIPPGRTVVGAKLDPRGVLPDTDRRNNEWRRTP